MKYIRTKDGRRKGEQTMNKGLEALEQLYLQFNPNLTSEDNSLKYKNTIEKELKALNVFKELKFFDLRCDRENGKMIYLLVWNAVAICRISERQYNLLKEVLNYDDEN